MKAIVVSYALACVVWSWLILSACRAAKRSYTRKRRMVRVALWYADWEAMRRLATRRLVLDWARN